MTTHTAYPNAATPRAESFGGRPSGRSRKFPLWLSVAVALGLIFLPAGGFIGWHYYGATVQGWFGSSASKGTVSLVASSQLVAVSKSLGQPIYWVGQQANTSYELTQTPTGRLYVRYLPPTEPASVAKQYLTVGTYPMANAYAVSQVVAARSTSVQIKLPGSGVAFYEKSHPTSVYVAVPGSNYQVEVFDPSATQARAFVKAGSVQAVAGAPAKAVASTGLSVRIASRSELTSLSKQLGQPIYWSGAMSKLQVEFRQTSDGRVYVRYLPSGEVAGSNTAHLTLGTYAVANAFATTVKLAHAAGAVQLKMKGGSGAVGFYLKQSPTSVYVAFPKTNYQIEVYDPVARVARDLVASGVVKPVS